MSSDLVTFLRARLDEDKTTGEEMQENRRWQADCGEPHDHEIHSDRGSGITSARVLAEVAAKRRIVELHRCTEEGEGLTKNVWDCDHCGQPWRDGCPTLRLLALPFSDHPDYDESWRP